MKDLDVLGAFIDEATQCLAVLNDKLLAVETEGKSDELIGEMFRAAHSMKGSAGFLNLDTIQKITHRLETVLDFIRQDKLDFTQNVVDALFNSFDMITALLMIARSDEIEPTEEIETALAILDEVMAKPVANASKSPEKSVELQLGAVPDWLLDRLTIDQVLESLIARNEGKTLWAIRFNYREFSTAFGDIEKYENLCVKFFQVIAAFPLKFSENSDAPLNTYSHEVGMLGWSSDDLPSIANEWPTFTAWQIVESDQLLPLQNLGRNSHSDSGEVRVTRTATVNIAASETIRIETTRLDQLMNVAGELIITRARLTQLTDDLCRLIENADLRNLEALIRHCATNDAHTAEKCEQSMHGLRRCQEQARSLRDAISELNRHTNTMQNAVMQARMVPIGPLFQRFHRLVRDVSKERGRQAKLVLHGESTELDKQVIDELSDPLTHMIRNSVDHGLESPNERVKLGKPAEGTVLLEAYHESGQICICIKDDGKGLDIERIKAKALEKGLQSEETLARLSPAEIFALIFEPGFSTAAQITNISGRGVGMDIVRKKITALKGAIEIASVAGQGTTFTIRLPLTLAMIRGLLIRVGVSRFAFPLELVREIIDIEPKEIRQTTGGGRVINLRGKIISLVDLPTLVGVQAAANPPTIIRAVVAKSGSEIFAVAVDNVLREEELVVKALAEEFQHLVGISGTSILGDGGIAMILDVIGLAEAARKLGKTG